MPAPAEIILRADQQEIKSAIYDGWNRGARNMLGVAVTGFGKSVCMSDIARDADRQQAPQIIIAHRQELVTQMSKHIAKRGIQHRIIGSPSVVKETTAEHRAEFGRSYLNPSAVAVVASVQTLMARQDELEEWGKTIRYAQGDEGHHYLRSNAFGKTFSLFPNAFRAFWTATPLRADGQGLGAHADGLIDEMFVSTPMRPLINRGDLCEYQIAVPVSDFTISEDAIGANGDFTPGAMKEASDKSHIVGDVVVEYCKHAYGKRGIVFATDVETSGKIAAQFSVYGIPAVSVSAKTPGLVRNEYIRRFRAGSIWVLVNVDLFGEGFDLPAVEVVSMARPTASLAVYLQQFGRALRTMAGKMYGLIIDHVSNYKRHNLPDIARAWTLDRRDKRAKTPPDPDVVPLTRCGTCSKAYQRVLLSCPHCGAAPVAPAGGGRTCEQVDGDLRLLAPDVLEKMRNAVELMSPAGVANRTTFTAGPLAGAGAANRQIERIGAQNRLKEAVAVWFGDRLARGEEYAMTEKRFYATMGMSTLEAYALPRADMERLSATIEGWMNVAVTV